MKKVHFCLIAVLFSINAFAAWPLRDTVEFSQRQGLPNFFAKATKGDSVRVGFLGGSITNAVGWRDNIMNWFKSRYNNNKIVQVNAAIGGTNSTFLVLFVQHKDLRHSVLVYVLKSGLPPFLIILKSAINSAKSTSFSAL